MTSASTYLCWEDPTLKHRHEIGVFPLCTELMLL